MERDALSDKEFSRIELPDFDGPLDLLLYLVRKHEFDVFDIPIAAITEKYLEHLDLIRNLNIDIASEFLLMAATLLQIKSRMILPLAVGAEEGEEGEAGPDPREELVRRLLEYSKYKEAALQLAEFPLLGWNVFARGAREQGEASQGDEISIADVDTFALLAALDRALSAAAGKNVVEITPENISVREKMIQVIAALEGRDAMQFSLLLFEGSSRREIIALFLAVLELAKMAMVRLVQAGETGEIYMQKSFQDFDSARGAVEDIWKAEA